MDAAVFQRDVADDGGEEKTEFVHLVPPDGFVAHESEVIEESTSDSLNLLQDDDYWDSERTPFSMPDGGFADALKLCDPAYVCSFDWLIDWLVFLSLQIEWSIDWLIDCCRFIEFFCANCLLMPLVWKLLIVLSFLRYVSTNSKT